MKLTHCHQVLFLISAERASIRLRGDCLAQVDWNAGKTNKYKVMFFNFLRQILCRIFNWYENLDGTLFGELRTLQLPVKFETLMVSCSRFAHDHKFQWTERRQIRTVKFSHTIPVSNPLSHKVHNCTAFNPF